MDHEVTEWEKKEPLININKRGWPELMFNKDHEVTGGEENEDQSESFLFFNIINNPVVARSAIGKILIYILTKKANA